MKIVVQPTVGGRALRHLRFYAEMPRLTRWSTLLRRRARDGKVTQWAPLGQLLPRPGLHFMPGETPAWVWPHFLACPTCQGRMKLLGLVENPAIISRTLATVREATKVPRPSPGRGPPYWRSRVLRVKVLGDDEDGGGRGRGADEVALGA